MYEYIQGKITAIDPAHVIIDNQGIGYYIHISLGTFSKIKDKESVKLYIHQAFKVEATTPVGIVMYGFFDQMERKLFHHLISVSRVGNNTAILMLSSLQPEEIYNAIVNNQPQVLTAVKGIGTKAAQRIIVDLKDKLLKEDMQLQNIDDSYNTKLNESLSALSMLGFHKNVSSKVLEKIMKEEGNENLPIEEIIKKALKIL